MSTAPDRRFVRTVWHAECGGSLSLQGAARPASILSPRYRQNPEFIWIYEFEAVSTLDLRRSSLGHLGSLNTSPRSARESNCVTCSLAWHTEARAEGTSPPDLQWPQQLERHVMAPHYSQGVVKAHEMKDSRTYERAGETFGG